MTDYSQMKCEVCRVGAPLATADEVESFLKQHSQWEKLVVDGEDRIQCKFQFKVFEQALAFTNQVGALAGRKVIIPRYDRMGPGHGRLVDA
ncbi:MAG: hypothetical protein Ct9H300mP14_12900 [Gammaproteobacteria bacterium]|nr:MAG: hypothetical protein Ct9H300mP14_12900 [Gammaproteobacteria bacterium]